jgi:thioredoxin-like negative regulator of GroEL
MVKHNRTILRGVILTDGKRVKTLEPQAFDVELYSSHEPLLVAFLKRNARFSGQSKVLDDTSREYRDRVNCYLYDADYLDTAMERFKVEGTPTFLLFSDGREVDRLMGESDRDSLDDFIRAVIPPKS